MNRIIYAHISNSNFGKVIIARTDVDDNLCAVLFGKTEKFLWDELIKIFPKSKILSTMDSKDFTDDIIQKINNDNENFNYSIDFCDSSPFQKLVWSTLMMIPKGETRTYKDIAIQIGKPNAVRAVGTACGKNPIAIIIPCHRVVSKNKNIINYRWGKEMKEKLLDREKLFLNG